MRKVIGTCAVCEKDLLAAPGQRVRFHGECRQEGKKRFGRSTGVRYLEVDTLGNVIPHTKVIVGE